VSVYCTESKRWRRKKIRKDESPRHLTIKDKQIVHTRRARPTPIPTPSSSLPDFRVIKHKHGWKPLLVIPRPILFPCVFFFQRLINRSDVYMLIKRRIFILHVSSLQLVHLISSFHTRIIQSCVAYCPISYMFREQLKPPNVWGECLKLTLKVVLDLLQHICNRSIICCASRRCGITVATVVPSIGNPCARSCSRCISCGMARPSTTAATAASQCICYPQCDTQDDVQWKDDSACYNAKNPKGAHE
jgi:hypothetical protein